MKEESPDTEAIPEEETSEEEKALRRYFMSLTPEDLEAMKRPARGDVMAKLRAHIERLKSEEAKAS